MADWGLRAVLPAGASFSGQMVYPNTSIEFPNTFKQYVQSIDIVYLPHNVYKHTGFEPKIYRLNTATGTDQDIDISIMMVGNLPRWACNILRNIAVGCNGSGLEIEVYDDWATNKQYRGRWINAGDFVDNNAIHTGASIDLLAFEEQSI